MFLKLPFKHKIEGDTLRVSYSGVILKKEMDEIMDKIYTLLRSNPVNKVFIDARESEVFLEFRESLEFASGHPPEFQKVKTAVLENKVKEP
jgi:hypothetical protein